LRRLTIESAHRRYGRTGPIPARILGQIEEELRVIAEVGYEEYFLLVWDILEDCKLRGIEWITRGSAADSLVIASASPTFAQSGSSFISGGFSIVTAWC
jgi:error-prone DNA polymerase